MVYHSYSSQGARLLFQVFQVSGIRVDVFINPDRPPTVDDWYMGGTPQVHTSLSIPLMTELLSTPTGRVRLNDTLCDLLTLSQSYTDWYLGVYRPRGFGPANQTIPITISISSVLSAPTGSTLPDAPAAPTASFGPKSPEPSVVPAPVAQAESVLPDAFRNTLVAGIVLISISAMFIAATVVGGVLLYLKLGRLYSRLEEKS